MKSNPERKEFDKTFALALIAITLINAIGYFIGIQFNTVTQDQVISYFGMSFAGWAITWAIFNMRYLIRKKAG